LALFVRYLTLVVEHRSLLVKRRAFPVKYRALLVRYLTMFVKCKALSVKCRALLLRCRALFVECTSLFVKCRALLVKCWRARDKEKKLEVYSDFRASHLVCRDSFRCGVMARQALLRQLREVGGWGRDPKKCTGRDWGMGSSTI